MSDAFFQALKNLPEQKPVEFEYRLYYDPESGEPLFYTSRDEPVNTDLAYAVAISFMGEENFIGWYGPKITHMKPRINQLTAEDWSKQLVWEILNGQVRLNGFAQHSVLHYHIKKLAFDFGDCYE